MTILELLFSKGSSCFLTSKRYTRSKFTSPPGVLDRVLYPISRERALEIFLIIICFLISSFDQITLRNESHAYPPCSFWFFWLDLQVSLRYNPFIFSLGDPHFWLRFFITWSYVQYIYIYYISIGAAGEVGQQILKRTLAIRKGIFWLIFKGHTWKYLFQGDYYHFYRN